MKLNILIIENERAVALRIRMVIVRLGHEIVAVVSDVKSAVAVARSQRCDLILCDVALGEDEDSVEIARTLQSLVSCRLIYIAAYREHEILKRIARTDFIGFLLKPVREEELEALVELAALRVESETHRKLFKIDRSYEYCFDCTTLFRDGKAVELTEKEHRLLRALLENPGELVRYDQFDLRIWGESPIDGNTRRQLVYRFKQKAPYFPLKLVKGFGYRIETTR